MSVLRRFLNLWRERALDREFDAELRFHTDMRIEANLRAGMSREDAEAEARKHLGGQLRVKEGMREARLLYWIDSFGRDLRHGWRVLWRQPALALLAVLTLSLGIGANASIFSLLNAVLIQPLPFPEADRLVAVADGFKTSGITGTDPTVPEILDVRSRVRTLEQLSFYDLRDFQINGGNEPERVFAARVDASFLKVLRVRPALGRLFDDKENLPGFDRVVVLADGLWKRNFGGDPSVIGRKIVVNGAPSEVVGILPPDFSFDYLTPEPIEMYVPFPMNDTYTSRSAPFANVRRVSAVARLKPGHDVDSAARELQAISSGIVAEHPELYRRGSDGQDVGFFMTALPLQTALTGGSRRVLALLAASVALVLLIACANTAQFLLSRSIEREGEVAVRQALGASRSRLVGQFLAESLILAAAGCLAGLLQATWLTRAMLAVLPQDVAASWVGGVRVDATVLLFTVGISLAATMACGLIPALHASRSGSALRDIGRGSTAPRTRSRQVLIAAEVGLSVLLLVASGLLVESLRRMLDSPAGYSSEGVTALRMRTVPDSQRAAPQYLERIAALPGVEGAAVASPPIPGFPDNEFSIEGSAGDAATLSNQRASYSIVSPGYFSTLRVPLLEGRDFRNDDATGRPPVAIVNEEMARRFWPGRTPIGQRIHTGPGPRAADVTIVGVVGNVRPVLQTEAAPQVYVPYLQQGEPNLTLLVRNAPGAIVVPESFKAELRAVLPNQPLFDIRPLREVASRSVADHKTVAALLSGFALLALFMSVTGVYSVVTYLISRRTKEIAIRLAVGGRAGDVLWLVGGQAFRSTLVGLALGLMGSVAAGAALRRVMVGMTTPEPATFVLVSGIYLVVVAVAICVPALRALRVDPASVLRLEG